MPLLRTYRVPVERGRHVIYRRNYLDQREHLEYRRRIHHDKKGTQETRAWALRLLLQWADSIPFPKAPGIPLSFPEFLSSSVSGRGGLSYSGQLQAVTAAKTFFAWARMAHPRRYKSIKPLWLESLRPFGVPGHARDHEAYEVADVLALLEVLAGDARTARIQAAAAFLFLSGARVGAFVTLPIKAIDLDALSVRQWPEMGVHTKFGKSATTHLMDIPDLLDVVRAWDRRVRAELPAEAMWYPDLAGLPGQETLVPVLDANRTRAHALRYDLQALCARAGVAYLSPHKFRHGFAVHALNNSKTPADWKAVSQTLMHSDLSTTDGVYGILKDEDVAGRIARLGGGTSGQETKEDLLRQLREITEKLAQL